MSAGTVQPTSICRESVFSSFICRIILGAEAPNQSNLPAFYSSAACSVYTGRQTDRSSSDSRAWLFHKNVELPYVSSPIAGHKLRRCVADNCYNFGRHSSRGHLPPGGSVHCREHSKYPDLAAGVLPGVIPHTGTALPDQSPACRHPGPSAARRSCICLIFPRNISETDSFRGLNINLPVK